MLGNTIQRMILNAKETVLFEPLTWAHSMEDINDETLG
jgi:hypothetical protein